MGKYYTDLERYEWCRKCRISGKPVSVFAEENGLCRSTLRDWMNAYKNINGKFINVNTVMEEESLIIEQQDIRVNMLSEIEKKKRRNHFDRFDHSVVEIKYNDLKITTSLEQAEKLLEQLYDKIL